MEPWRKTIERHIESIGCCTELNRAMASALEEIDRLKEALAERRFTPEAIVHIPSGNRWDAFEVIEDARQFTDTNSDWGPFLFRVYLWFEHPAGLPESKG